MISTSDIGIIILAAGDSTRMGQSKQLLDAGGETFLARSVHTALASNAASVLVVLGSQATEHQKSIAHLSVKSVINPDWHKGMGSSLRAGLQELLKQDPSTKAIIVMVCDQPFLSTDHLNQLINAQQRGDILCASAYSGTFGVPAIFDSGLFPALLRIDDQSGARGIIQKYRSTCVSIPFPMGEMDVDTPEDYQKFIESK